MNTPTTAATTALWAPAIRHIAGRKHGATGTPRKVPTYANRMLERSTPWMYSSTAATTGTIGGKTSARTRSAHGRLARAGTLAATVTGDATTLMPRTRPSAPTSRFSWPMVGIPAVLDARAGGTIAARTAASSAR